MIYNDGYIAKIEFWSRTKYQFSFQTWGFGNNNVYIYKNEVEIHSAGGFNTIEDLFSYTFKWCERANPSIKYS